MTSWCGRAVLGRIVVVQVWSVVGVVEPVGGRCGRAVLGRIVVVQVWSMVGVVEPVGGQCGGANYYFSVHVCFLSYIFVIKAYLSIYLSI